MSGRRRASTLLVIFLGLLTMAPTAGDVGGCGSEATLLDRDRFEEVRKAQDCDRCQACELATAHCSRACNAAAAPDLAIPDTCRPLFHDGVVCLRALAAASCDAYAAYVDDVAPTVPSECAFCRGQPALPGFSDGGAP